MTKPKAKHGFRTRVSRALDNVFGSPSSTSPSSPKPVVPSQGPPSSTSDTPGPSLQAHVSTLAVSAPTSPIQSTAITPTTVPALTAPLLHIPDILHNPDPASSGSAVWNGLGTALRTLYTNSALFPSLQGAIGGLLSCVEAIGETTKNTKEYKDLARELQTLSETLDRHLNGVSSSPMMEFIVETMELIQEQIDIMAKARNNDPTRRVLEAQRVQEALAACYNYIQSLCRQLQIEAGLSMRSIAKEQQHAQIDRQNAQLEAMKPAKLAAFDSSLATDINRRTCTKDTRTNVLHELSDWFTNPDTPNVCWMNGMAGTGKTTIACTFAETLKNLKQLAASFFCTRTTDECRDVTRIIPTIAYQLARHSEASRSALCRALDDEPDAVFSKALTQFDRLIKRPLLEVKDEMREGLVVVIDALDECTASNGVELVLDTLLRVARDLPLKFFVASRPEPKIWSKIQNQPEESRSVFVLHHVRYADVQADIELYLRDELPLVPPVELKKLAELSGSLFIYAATTVRYIRAGEVTGEFDECLERMLSVTRGLDATHNEIDSLYMAILEAADNIFVVAEVKARMRLVLWTAVCAREPVSVETLAAMANVGDTKKAMAMLQPLRSVLFVSDNGSIVSTLHASFPDFMLSQSRSAGFFCDHKGHNQLITRCCFDILRNQLRFNICELDSSYLSDAEVPGFKERVDQTISPTLSYACRYWAYHLNEVPASEDLRAQLQVFLMDQFLFWMEVMNLKQWMGISVHVVLEAKRWLNRNYQLSELSREIEDAQQLVTSFAGNPVSQSTPHLYVSALALCHRSSTVYKHYWARSCGLIEPRGEDTDRRTAVALASWLVNSEVYSVAYSPDGAYIAAGCHDGRVIINDAYNGAFAFPPLVGHGHIIYSVAFLPNGTHIASGSGDHTIRIRNMQNGTLAYPPIRGHSGAVLSLAVSPNGMHIASGSADSTIRTWNSQDGTPASTTPFEGHTDSVRCVVFSPDGTRVISGSADGTICVWSVKGSTLIEHFEGHSYDVACVAVSPGGAYIVSGSYDRTIHTWDMHNGTPMGAPLIGHTDWVESVALSPDGTYIASGSDDRTVRLWDTRTGAPVGNPFDGHTGYVMSVTFSPDGTRIVSGSRDGSVRVWNAHNHPTTNASVQGHSHAVNCLAASADGTRIVSGSDDHTLRIWDSRYGTLIGGPLCGHTTSIRSVAFSPDSELVVSGSDDCTIRVWKAHEASLVSTIEGHTDGVTSVAFSPDGTRIVSGSYDRTTRVWDVRDGSLIDSLIDNHSTMVLAALYSPDGRLIAFGSAGGLIRIWDIQDGTLRRVGAPFCGHSGWVRSIDFSPDGALIVSGSDDLTVCVWNVQDGTPVGRPFRGHTHYVMSVLFSPDGQLIISGSMDRTIRLWNAQDGTLICAPFEGHTYWITSLAISLDGTHIFSSSRDSSIRAWSLSKRSPIADTWTIAEDGWVKGPDSKRLFWTPADVVSILPSPFNHWVIGRYGPITVDYNNVLLGKEWHGCYVSTV